MEDDHQGAPPDEFLKPPHLLSMPKQGAPSVLPKQGHGQVVGACLCCSWSRPSQPEKML